ncbi:WD repeat-containing protein 89 [Eumeta japonica]|uniref:WD repeat-containing protein 89 n=1 Tax=Eumeta variegata TaxID=151549 RepID=A0A4C1V0D7_EUMVA|nr:WD repeat-containing protein 89 [Eumeta japonica]
MLDIVDNEERDKDTMDQDGLLNHFKKKYSLIGEKVISTDKSYVNKLSGTKSLKLVLSLSNDKLQVYELRGPSVSAICKLSGHSKTVTEVLFSPKEDNLIYSCAVDGVIKLWDVRVGGSCVQEYKVKRKNVFNPKTAERDESVPRTSSKKLKQNTEDVSEDSNTEFQIILNFITDPNFMPDEDFSDTSTSDDNDSQIWNPPRFSRRLSTFSDSDMLLLPEIERRRSSRTAPVHLELQPPNVPSTSGTTDDQISEQEWMEEKLSNMQWEMPSHVDPPVIDYTVPSSGEIVAQQSREGIVGLKWRDKRDVLMLSTKQSGLKTVAKTNRRDEEATETRPLECMDVSSTGRVLCAGSQLVQDDAFLIFWDSRATAPLGGYWNSHTDDITQIKFHKEKSEILATGASDGLVNVFNILEQTEDDALIYSLNIENSVEALNWLDDKHLSCITQSNDLQIWDSVNGDLLKTFARSDICKSIKRSKEDDCYAVNTYTSAQGVPVLLAGSHADNGSCLRSVSIGERRLQPCTDFSPNKQVVRCCWYQPQEDLLVTAGEAASVDVWRGAGGDEPAPVKFALGHTQRYKPY